MKGFISKDSHPVNYIFLLLGYLAGGFFVGNFISVVVLQLSYGISLPELGTVVANPASHPHGREAVNLFQGISHLCTFTGAPLALLLSFGQPLGAYLNPVKNIPLALLVLSALLIVLIMPANSWIIEFNTNMHLPAFMAGFESWAKAKEEALKKLTEYLTRFNSAGDFMLGLLIFGLIPAVGEELVFRGVIQRQLIRWFRNPHVGIWVTALLFGAIHLQFYGMLPRTLLGALLGYLYWWSGNIWVPILGHFMNNGFTVLLMYLLQIKVVNYDLDSTAAMPLPAILFSGLATAALLYFLQDQFRAWRALQAGKAPGPE
jgi:membrane protease YdiL (CAAX protease family)